ncbi:4-alpha-glucanotransferase [Celerinatantimonas yamalensis]|uniref:4-alpha-glucanotransferase n=1 Tax=Celerinatantimonas yamalensis TaxID=559956 RepID=A0ABW9GBR5_9GAMM
MSKTHSPLHQERIEQGLYVNYVDASKELVTIDAQTLDAVRALLPAPQTASSQVQVLSAKRSFTLPTDLSPPCHWQLNYEQGDVCSGVIPLLQTYWQLPADAPLGYHRLTIKDAEQTHHIQIIHAPTRCYQPSALKKQRWWGSCIQLYTLRSNDNWGIGDFVDLQHWLEHCHAHGAAFVGLNPIHALYPGEPERASPYSPSSRRWLNIIYISVATLDDFTQSRSAQRWYQSLPIQQRLQALRERDIVDYTQVTQLKLVGLHLAYRHFCRRDANDPYRLEFESFTRQHGKPLFWQGCFDTLHRYFRRHNQCSGGWQYWPQAYQHPESDTVQHFAKRHPRWVQFYCWLQWLADQQLQAAAKRSTQLNMPIGLYRDVAVGVAADGAQAWSQRELFSLDASVGAPPDILGPLGQNWALPAQPPTTLIDHAYQPFIEMIEANMRGCGALRIDHVMGLLRLWWIPRGQSAAKGAYVHYPLDDLLAILALESQRHQCLVIGEDLGTVPDAIIEKLHDAGILSYKVLYFEKDAQQRFTLPQHYAHQAMATLTTHDLPTLLGYLRHHDLHLGAQLGLYPNKTLLAHLHEQRSQAAQQLTKALAEVIPKAQLAQLTLNQAVHIFLSQSRAMLLGLQPEDWLEMLEPVNIPGTDREYPNWRRKLSRTTEQIFADTNIQWLLAHVQTLRHPHA